LRPSFNAVFETSERLLLSDGSSFPVDL